MTGAPNHAESQPGHEPDVVRLIYAYLLSASCWLMIGTAYGLIAATKLYWPDYLALEYLSFGRIRPIHTNTLFWGWSSQAAVGLALFVVSRTCRVKLWSTRLAWHTLWLWNLVVTAGIWSLTNGVSSGPQEYREWTWPIATLFGICVLLTGYNCYMTIAKRTTREIYISNWYILGALCWLGVLYVTAYLPFYQRGLGNIVVQGYYMHTGVGLWFTPLVLGITYYSLPRLLSKPIYSYSLGVLGFWTNLLFYTLIGAHHFIFSPIPWWLQTTAILFSVGMMVPVWSGTGNFFLTAHGSWGRVRRSYPLIFILVGVWGYALSSTQGTIEAFRTANVYWHFTNVTVGHSHLAMYGFVAFLMWGALYGLVPRITGQSATHNGIALHFWLSFLGACIYIVSITWAGVAQGISWVAGDSFVTSLESAAPLWLWRTVGGLLMALSHVVFVRNLWAMRPYMRTATYAREQTA